MDDASSAQTPDIRRRTLAAAADLVARGGPDALTTRAVAAAAGTQGPTIYRLFGDKQGLLDALAEHALAEYSANTAARPRLDDPVAELRAAWDEHIAFGLSHPDVYRLMTGLNRAGNPSPAARAGLRVLRDRVRRMAAAGRLRVAEEAAVALIHAAGTGTVVTLLEKPVAERDPGLPKAALSAVMAVILAEPAHAAAATVPTLAASLRASLGEAVGLTPGERLLLDELLRRLSTHA